jgi:hypothetical protein
MTFSTALQRSKARYFSAVRLTTDRIFMADARFGCEADMAGLAAGTTRSLVTHSGPRWGCQFSPQQSAGPLLDHLVAGIYTIGGIREIFELFRDIERR